LAFSQKDYSEKAFSISLLSFSILDMLRNMPSFYSEFDKKIKSDITEIEKDNKEMEKAFSE
jgi:F0F1-type ATP synthase membrane subunit b/b'